MPRPHADRCALGAPLASGHIPGDLDDHVRHHYAVWRQAAERVRALDLTLGTKAKERGDVVKRLETVPGVGPIVALTTIAVFAEVGRFASAKHARGQLQWPRPEGTFQSGDRGCARAYHQARVRGAAHDAVRGGAPRAAPDAPAQPCYFTRIAARRGHKTAVVAVAHRLCRILFAMLRDGADFDRARIGVEAGHFTRA